MPVLLVGPGSFEPLADTEVAAVVVVVVGLAGLRLVVLALLEVAVVFREDLVLGLGRPEGDDFLAVASDALAAVTVGGEVF